MGSDIFTLMATYDAAEAARDAAYEASRGADEAERLADLQSEQARSDTRNALNKMLQDYFYDREPDFYRLSQLQAFIEKYPQALNRRAFPQRTWFPKFPFMATAVSAIFFICSYLASIPKGNNFWLTTFIILSIISALITWADIKEWSYFTKAKKEQIENDRLMAIDETYLQLMTDLEHEFSMLSARGIVAKYEIDRNVEQTYNALLKLNAKQANKALLKLYYVVLDLRELSDANEAAIVTMFHKREEFSELAQKNQLFSSESLQIYRNLQES